MATQSVKSSTTAATDPQKAAAEAKKRAAEAAKRAAEAAKKAAEDAAKRTAAEAKKRSGAETKYATGQEQFFKRGEKNRPSTRSEPAKGVAPKGPSTTQVCDAQEKLNLWLKSVGHPERQVKVDGKMGADTKQMIEYFQSREHLPKTGQLDLPTLQRLGDAGADAIRAGLQSQAKDADVAGRGVALNKSADKALKAAKDFISDHKSNTMIGSDFKAALDVDLPKLMKQVEALKKEKPTAFRNDELAKATSTLETRLKELDARFKRGAAQIEVGYQVATKSKAGADFIMATLGNAAPGVKAAYDAITSGITELQKDGSLERRLANAVLASGTSAALSRWGGLAGDKTKDLSAKFLAGAASAVTEAASKAVRGMLSLEPGDKDFDKKFRGLIRDAATDAVFGTAGAALSTAFDKTLRDKADKALGELKPVLEKLKQDDPAGYAQKKDELLRNAVKDAVLSAAAPFERQATAYDKLAKAVAGQVPKFAAELTKEINALPPNDPKWGEHAMGIIDKHLVTAAGTIAMGLAKDPVTSADFGTAGNNARAMVLELLKTHIEKPLIASAAKAAQGAPPPKT